VTVWDQPYTGTGYAPLPLVVDVAGAAEERAPGIVEDVAVHARAAGVDVETIVRRGFPVDEISSVAKEQDARVIVIGSHGWGSVRRTLFGSVSQGVVLSARCPVLVVPAAADAVVPRGRVRRGSARLRESRDAFQPPPRCGDRAPAERLSRAKNGVSAMKPIILATDGSATAVAATEEAIRLARACDAPLIVVTAWDIPYVAPGAAVAMFPDFGAMPSVPHVDAARERAETAAAEAARQARGSALEVETVVQCGAPVDEICGLAKRREARLIVIGSRGWGPVRGALFSSVSAGVLHHAPCPVLVVPARSGGEANETTRGRVATEV